VTSLNEWVNRARAAADEVTVARAALGGTKAARAQIGHLASVAAKVTAQAGAAAAGKPSRVIVGLSGGKDSLCVLDLCARHFDHVEAFFMYLVPGLECAEGPARAAAKRAGVRLHMVPHFQLPELLQLHRPLTKRKKTRALGLFDIEARVRLDSGIDWVAYGWRESDSMHRRWHLRKSGHADVVGRRLFPIASWVKADVLGYLHARRIPVPKSIGQDNSTVSGIGLDGESLRWMRDHYPRDYAKVLRVFPFAHLEVVKLETYGDRGRQAAQQFNDSTLWKGPKTDGSQEGESAAPASNAG
jgi:3'-phosphoadenosine 5'-phosphosulfate sulfotransferase (PAPS reductase)/FAD synthetase